VRDEWTGVNRREIERFSVLGHIFGFVVSSDVRLRANIYFLFSGGSQQLPNVDTLFISLKNGQHYTVQQKKCRRVDSLVRGDELYDR
jgi:hypothetical protein